MNWHLLSVKAVLEKLNTTENGLSKTESTKRLQQYGLNELISTRKSNPIKIFLKQFINIMIIAMIVGIIISMLLNEFINALVILIIVILNAIIGFSQEYNAEKAIEALKKIAQPMSMLLRNGETHKVNSTNLVPGDIILLDAGTKIPADIRITESYSLKIDEASLTGESFPIDKISNEISDVNVVSTTFKNMAYKGTIVTYGRGKGIVLATGMNTKLGKIAEMLSEKEPLTPLQLRMNDLSRKLTFIITIICIILFIVGYLEGKSALDMLLLSLSVAVAAIPEALPGIIAISLSIGAKVLIKHHSLVRRLYAVETLGTVSFICTDKTGTLTQNKMKVSEIWSTGTEQSLSLLLEAMYLNNDVEEKENELFGDPTEVALFLYAQKHGAFKPEWESKQRISEIPFNSERKLMTTVYKSKQEHLIITKGAIESIKDICIDVEDQKELNHQIKEMTQKGHRVIAYAYKKMDTLSKKTNNTEKDLHFLGIVGLIDPIREEVKKAIQECKTAKITTVMLTGDHPETAAFVARELGIISKKGDLIITGGQLGAMPQKELEQKIEHIRVYASVSPSQKLRIIKALQRKGHFVAMTGDGVNDAPSVKMANIGIAMGITGTDVTKEAANMILLDDNFSSIVRAIKQGRRIYDNIRKFIHYIIAGNAAELFSILLAPVFGLPLPLLPIHILWINLVSDGLPALALAFEPAEKNIMKRPPRKASESIFSDHLGKKILITGGFLSLIIIGSQALLIAENVKHWQTIIFSMLCFGQLWQVLSIRSETETLYKIGIFTNLYLAGAILITILLQLAIIYIPILQFLFHTSPLSIKELLFTFVISSLVFWLLESLKIVRKFNKNKDLSSKILV
jgi:Ca2+-transporting ATPase